MHLYLPVADVVVPIGLILALGGGVGFISGLFGVGGGFLLTPLLIMNGVPPAVAVATQAPQIVASAFSAVLAYIRRGAVDFRMGWVLLLSGLVGSWVGVELFSLLRRLGQVEFVVTALYVVLLGLVGALMAYESWGALRNGGAASAGEQARPVPPLFERLPFPVTFPRIGATFSALPPLAIGFVIGVLGAVMGVGGGFIMVPAMIYLLGMRTTLAVGTSLFQVMVVMAAATVLHAMENGSVDALLALLLLAGGVVGAQLGALLGNRLHGSQLRMLLALLVLGVGAALATQLFSEPEEPFSIEDSRPAEGAAAAPAEEGAEETTEGLRLEGPLTPIAINIDFAGVEAAFRGAAPRDADLLVALIGERRGARVLRKGERFGMWLNVEDRIVAETPIFYASAASGGAAAALAAQAKLGLDDLIGAVGPARGGDGISGAPARAFREAAERLRAASGDFAPGSGRIEREAGEPPLAGEAFTARFALPKTLREGGYEAVLVAFRDGREIGRATQRFAIRKEGWEGAIHRASIESPLLYGVATLIAAIAAGFLAHAVFGRLSARSTED